jgi:hypothetical protein
LRGDLPIPRSGTTGRRRGELPRSKPARLCGDGGSGEPCRSKAPSICIDEDGGEVAKTARFLLHDGGPLPSISSSGLEEELATDQSRPFPFPSPSWRESTTTGRMHDGVGVLLEDGLFWVLGFFSVLRSKALFAYGVRTLAVDSLTLANAATDNS